MTASLVSRIRAFAADQDGSAVVPFALWAPIFVAVIISGVELGALTARHTALESALDKTVREVRLGTGTVYDHSTLKTSICEKAAILPHCTESLLLEMIKLDIRDWQMPPEEVACRDASEDVAPVTTFEYGRDNELMFLRACYKFEPLSPVVGLGSMLETDQNGETALVSQAAFVQEPS